MPAHEGYSRSVKIFPAVFPSAPGHRGKGGLEKVEFGGSTNGELKQSATTVRLGVVIIREMSE